MEFITTVGDFDFEVSVEYDAINSPGKFNGPPEDCYPDESELDVTSVTLVGDLPEGATHEDFLEMLDDYNQVIIDRAWEHFMNCEPDDY